MITDQLLQSTYVIMGPSYNDYITDIRLLVRNGSVGGIGF